MDGVEVVGERFAVASGSPEATAAAALILRSGGNVVDAALAGSAALCVTSPQAVALGGDLFALITRPGATPIAVNGTGAAPMQASIPYYRSRGHAIVPVIGPLSIQTPGLVAAWQALSDNFTSRPLGELLAPAIALARDGFAVTPRLAALTAAALSDYRDETGWAATYLPDGAVPEPGTRLRQPRLAETLGRIAHDGPRAFYHGAIARDIAATVQRAGGVLSEADLAQVAAEVLPALPGRYAGRTIWTQPPISQGVVLLRALALIEQGRDAIAAFQRAFAERLALLGDTVDSRARAEAMRDGRLPVPGIALPFAAQSGPETTTICVMDRDGNAASLILSVFADFGAGVVGEETGVLLNNRLSGFFLDPTHPNALAPGRRTMHTLHSVLVQDDSGIVMAGGSPGGDNQPQVNAQILTRVLGGGADLATVVGLPRWAYFPGTIPADLASPPAVKVEPAMAPAERARIARDWKIMLLAGPDIGSAKWVARGQRPGTVRAVTDRRRDGTVWAA
jgi:gamma-glutamyltranspeptidase/glutathione hydrolase